MSQLYITDSSFSFMLCQTNSWVMFPSPGKGVMEVLRVIALAKDAKQVKEALDSRKRNQIVINISQNILINTWIMQLILLHNAYF